MSYRNYASREITFKIVYYGPGLGGKTTNIEYLHATTPEASRGKMTKLATETDRTLFFDFMPLSLGEIRGFKMKFGLYSVPGQFHYDALRKLILSRLDGVVFVADSQVERTEANDESMINLRANLAEHGHDLDKIPFVIQYNKRDLPNAAPIDELQQLLNPRNVPSFEAVAPKGEGVFETLKAIIRQVIIKQKGT